ncbi:MAG: response regulator [Myxococcales bacterium]|nr:response regulator [Myxococcales bacterium]
MARLIIVEDSPELASLIAASARSRGHVARAAHTAQAALAALETGSFDAAVVDLLLPDMRGSELLDQLHSRGVPAIAMSGVFKGDRFADEAREHGAKAFFEKPFDMAALLSKAEELAGGDSVAAADDGAGFLEELQELPAIHDDRPGPPTPAEPTESSPALPPLEDWERIWTTRMPEAKASRPRRREVPAWAQGGDLSKTSVPRLLNAYYQARHRGELVLKQGQVIKVVYFEEGRPVYAASNLARERFARFCARQGLLPQEELDAVAALAKEEGIRTGEAMVRLGLFTAEKRRELLEAQIKDILWSTFPWAEGEYSFSTRGSERADLVKLSVFPGTLILEGVARTETLMTLRQKMKAKRRLFPTADPPYALHELTLSGAQATLIAHADGSKTVEDLLTLADLPEKEALATLLGLELMGVLEERRDEGKQRRISYGL